MEALYEKDYEKACKNYINYLSINIAAIRICAVCKTVLSYIYHGPWILR